MPKTDQMKSVRPLFWEKVNSATWKLTDGRQIETPRSHGQWPGFMTLLALGWIMQVDEDWIGRVTIRRKRMSSGPAAFEAAKRWVENRVKNVPISKPLPQSAYRMSSARWLIRVEHDLRQTILEREIGVPAPPAGKMNVLALKTRIVTFVDQPMSHLAEAANNDSVGLVKDAA